MYTNTREVKPNSPEKNHAAECDLQKVEKYD